MKNRALVAALLSIGLSVGAALAQEIESFIIKPEDVKKTSVEFKKDGSAILDCVLTRSKTAEFAHATERNLNRKLRLVINDKVVSEPIVRETITGGSLSLQIKSVDDAVELAKFLTTDVPNKEPEATR